MFTRMFNLMGLADEANTPRRPRARRAARPGFDPLEGRDLPSAAFVGMDMFATRDVAVQPIDVSGSEPVQANSPMTTITPTNEDGGGDRPIEREERESTR
jgi:hypothetical protein